VGGFNVVFSDTIFMLRIINTANRSHQLIKLGEIENVYFTKINDVYYTMSFWEAILNNGNQKIRFILIMQAQEKIIHAVGTKIGDDTIIYYLNNKKKFKTTEM
jgi:hypothetical protein